MDLQTEIGRGSVGVGVEGRGGGGVTFAFNGNIAH